jgi:uncharacterized protein (DUF2336 family)
MTVLLDDPSPLVRRALADALAGSDMAPHGVILALAQDQPDIAGVVTGRSPMLSDGELVDLVGGLVARVQRAIAGRAMLTRAVSGAIAEVADAAACLVLIENPGADVSQRALARISERFGHLSAIREALLARSDLGADTRQALVATLSTTLARFVAERDWLSQERAERIAHEACERATIAIASGRDEYETASLVRHLMESGQLTSLLLLRALLSGNARFVAETFAELSGVSAERVASVLADHNAHGFRALYERAGLPQPAFEAFRAAVQALQEFGPDSDLFGTSMLKRRMVERVLALYAGNGGREIDYLLALLRRFAAEAAREEARYFTADLVAAA